MNGSVLANMLNIDTSDKNNVIKLNGPDINTLVILMYSEKKDESTNQEHMELESIFLFVRR